MDTATLLIGLAVIVVGFLVKRFPGLIAGYNTMPKEMKEKVDIEGMSTFMRNGLIIIGATIIVGYHLFALTGMTTMAELMKLIPLMAGVVIMVTGAQRYDHNERSPGKKKPALVITGVVVVLVGGLLSYGSLPSKAIVTGSTVRFTGMYGFTMNIADIKEVALTDRRPGIMLRTNGFNLGTINKGYFKLREHGKTRLLLHSDKPPFLMLSDKDGKLTIINYRDASETEQVYEKIRSLIE